MTKEMIEDYMTASLPYLFGIFIIFMVCGIISTHSRWNRIANPFRTRVKIGHSDDCDHATVHIDGRRFQNLMAVVTDQGLYIAHWGLLPQIMMPKRVMIPWRSLSNIYIKQRTVFGFTVEEYFVNTSGNRIVRLQIPSGLAKEILQRNFLKQD